MPNRALALALWITVTFSTAAHSQSLSASGCSPKHFAADTVTEARSFGHGITQVPKAMVRPKNLAWELPVAAATGLLITKADIPLDRRVKSLSFERSAGRISNLAWGLEFASGAVAYGAGCGKHDHYMRDTGFKALAAMGAAGAADFVLKEAFDRQYPYVPGSGGKFWGGGRSFPSGHAATSFAFASVVAHRYPHKAWVKWGAYGLAAAISGSRYTAKKHYASDILVGATLGYVTGAYMANH
jgi:membrane-associated phospholipid phosphatase